MTWAFIFYFFGTGASRNYNNNNPIKRFLGTQFFFRIGKENYHGVNENQR